MALAYLLDPCEQYQNRAGVNNVNGYFEVFRMDTDDRATVYTDFNGTLAPAHIGIDNDGRAVMVVESGIPYRVEMHGPNGELFWTQQPVWTVASGGGVSATNIVSTDGSISIDKYTVGSVTNYDIGIAPSDSDEFLEWVQCVNSDIESGTVYPAYVSGTMETHAGQGLHVGKDRFYHVTSAFTVTPPGTGTTYETLTVALQFNDGTSMTNLVIKQFDVDTSVSYNQNFEFACDFKAPADGYLYWGVIFLPAAGSVRGVLQAHRIYSGINAVPDTCATKQWVEEYYGELSRDTQADWTENDSSKLSYIRHRPDLSLYVTDSEMESILSGYATAQDLQNAIAGVNQVPASTSSDANKVLTVDSQGVPGWAAAQAPISAGDGISISNNVVSAKVDGTTVTVNASGELQASAPVTVDQIYDPTSTNPQSGTAVAGAVANKQDTLTAGTGIDITGNTISCTASFTQQQADWAQDDSTKVDYIKHRPDLSVYATTQAMNTALAGKQDTISDLQTIREGAAAGATAVQPAALNDYATTSAMNTALAGKQDVLTAGTNISISGSTISATDTTYSAGTGLSLSGTEFSVDSTVVAMKSDLPDLTDYVTDTELSTILQGYQEALTAGSNITISNGTISAVDTTYTAGTGLSLNGTEFSVDTTTIATQSDLAAKQDSLTAGNGITLSGSTISAKVDGSTITTNASGELVATGGQVPAMKELVAGNNITLTEGANDVTVAATGIPTIGTVTV